MVLTRKRLLVVMFLTRRLSLAICEFASLRVYERDLHENEPVGGTHFHTNGFARRLVLTQRDRGQLGDGLLNWNQVWLDFI